MHSDTTGKEAAIILLIAAIAAFALFNIQSSTESINQITGAVLTTVNISPFPNVPCNFTVEQDWNLVSFYCIALLESRDMVTDNITGLISIFEYQEGATDPWKSYNPSIDSSIYVQDLQYMSRAEGYWINMQSPESIFVYGGLRIPTDVPLSAGWNLVGYPTNETKDTNQSLISIYGNYTEIRGYNATTDTYLSFIPPATGGLRNTTPYQGYWINATTSEVWVVD